MTVGDIRRRRNDGADAKSVSLRNPKGLEPKGFYVAW